MLAWPVNLGLSLELFMEDQKAKSMGPLLQADGLLLCTSMTFFALLRSCPGATFRVRPHGLNLQLIFLCVVTHAEVDCMFNFSVAFLPSRTSFGNMSWKNVWRVI